MLHEHDHQAADGDDRQQAKLEVLAARKEFVEVPVVVRERSEDYQDSGQQKKDCTSRDAEPG